MLAIPQVSLLDRIRPVVLESPRTSAAEFGMMTFCLAARLDARNIEESNMQSACGCRCQPLGSSGHECLTEARRSFSGMAQLRMAVRHDHVVGVYFPKMSSLNVVRR